MTRRIFAALAAMPIVLSFHVAAFAQATASAPKTIDVTGHGDSSAKPDLMTLSFAVTSHSDSADECTRKESEISQRVVAALKATLGDSAKVSTAVRIGCLNVLDNICIPRHALNDLED